MVQCLYVRPFRSYYNCITVYIIADFPVPQITCLIEHFHMYTGLGAKCSQPHIISQNSLRGQIRVVSQINFNFYLPFYMLSINGHTIYGILLPISLCFCLSDCAYVIREFKKAGWGLNKFCEMSLCKEALNYYTTWFESW